MSRKTHELKSGAYISTCEYHRYSLWRVWDVSQPYALFIMLNPSTADGTHDDATIRRCVNYARDLGYGGLYVGNLFSYRSSSPKDLKTTTVPVGCYNDGVVLKLAKKAGVVVVAWGADGTYLGRAGYIRALLQRHDIPLYCLALTKHGEPRHPLYLKKELTPLPYSAHGD